MAETETGWTTQDATPRPWRAYKGNPGDDCWFVARDTGSVSAYGAAVTGWGRVQQTEADAKLIAAAVNSYSPSDFEQLTRLREAAEAALTFAERIRQHSDHPNIEAQADKVIAALRKATTTPRTDQ